MRKSNLKTERGSVLQLKAFIRLSFLFSSKASSNEALKSKAAHEFATVFNKEMILENQWNSYLDNESQTCQTISLSSKLMPREMEKTLDLVSFPYRMETLFDLSSCRLKFAS